MLTNTNSLYLTFLQSDRWWFLQKTDKEDLYQGRMGEDAFKDVSHERVWKGLQSCRLVVEAT